MRDRVQPQIGICNDSSRRCRVQSRGVSPARSAASVPSPSIRCARCADLGFAAPARSPAPRGCDGRSARRCRVRPAVRWQARPSVPANGSTISVRFHARTFGPKPFSSTDRMVSMTWAWGLARPSSPDIPVHVEIGDHGPSLRTPSARSRGRARCPGLASSRAEGELDLARQLGVLADFEGPRHRSRVVRGRSMPAAHVPANSTSEWTTPRLAEKSWLRSNRSSRSREPGR